MNGPKLHNNRIAELVYKYLLNQLSETEKSELDQWVAASPQHQVQFDEMTNRAWLQTDLEKYNTVNTEGIWNKIKENVPGLHVIPISPGSKWLRFAIAASVSSLLIIGGWYFISNRSSRSSDRNLSVHQHHINE